MNMFIKWFALVVYIYALCLLMLSGYMIVFDYTDIANKIFVANIVLSPLIFGFTYAFILYIKEINDKD